MNAWSGNLPSQNLRQPKSGIWKQLRAGFDTAGATLVRDALVLETLMSFKRAGCSGVLTYHAAHAAKLLG